MKWRRSVVVALGFGLSWLGCAAQRTTAPGAAPTRTADADPAYALSKGSKRLLQTLKQPLRIDAYVTRGGADGDRFADDLSLLLAAYEREAHGKLKLRVIDVRTSEARAQARQAGVAAQALDVGAATPDTAGEVAGFFGLTFEYGSEKAVIPQLPIASSDGLEFWVTNKIHEIRDKADHIVRRIGLLTGKGELGLGDANLVKYEPNGKMPTILGILNQAFPFYGFEPVDLHGGASVIDPGIEGLIVTQPRQDYVEAELRRLDEFVMLGGKSLVVYASAVNLEPYDASMLANLSTHGIDGLLDGYGIHMNRDAVVDHGEQFRVQVLTRGDEKLWIRYPAIPHVVYAPPPPGEEQALDASFAGFFRMDEVVMPFASSLDLRPRAQPADIELRAVARSSAAAGVETSSPVNLQLRERWEPRPPFRQRILAAYALGKLQSAFAAKPAPARAAQRSARASRVLVVSSSLFLTNPFAYVANPRPESGGSGDAKLLMFAQPYTKYLTATILSVKNTLDWMIGDEDLIAVSAKLIRPQRAR